MGTLSRRRMLAGLGIVAGSLAVGFEVTRGQLSLNPLGNSAKTNAAGTPLPFKVVVPAEVRATSTPTPLTVATPRVATATVIPSATALPTTYGPATVVVWHGHPEWKNGGADLGKAFTQTYSQITVKVSSVSGGIAKIREALATKDAADVLEVPTRPALDSIAGSGHLLDLSRALDRTGWSAVATAEVTVDDKLRAVPFAKYIVGIAYDVATFQKAGIANPPKTWSDLGAAFAALKKIDAIPQATAVKDGSLIYYTFMGLASVALGPTGFAGLLAGSVHLNASNLVAVLDQIVDWSDSYQKKPEASNFLEARTLFATGQAASVVASSTDLAGYAQVATDRKLGFLAWPASDASHDPLANRGLASLFGVHAETTVPEAALGFARWLGTPPAAQVALDNLGILPALDGVTPSSKDALTNSLLAIPASVPVWHEQPLLAGLPSVWIKSGPDLMTKKLSSADFAEALQADVDKRRSA